GRFQSPSDAVRTSCTLAAGSNVVEQVLSCGPAYTSKLAGQPDGAYRLSVVAVDAAGNASAPADATYNLHTVAPAAPIITDGPTPTGTQATTSWAFSGPAGATL